MMADAECKPREPLTPTTDYERDVIGSAIRDQGHASELINRTRPQYFRDPFHRDIMREAERQWGVDQVFDPLRIGKALRQKHQTDDFDPVYYLAELASVDNLPNDVHFGSRLNEVLKAAAKIQIYQVADDAAAGALNGKDPGDILRHLKAGIEDIERDQHTEIVLPKASSIESRSIDWVWLEWLHRGGLTLLDGDPERGKSQITCDVAARWSFPRPFPFMQGDHFREPSNVLMVATEDGAGTTVRPRLEAAGANLDSIYLWPEDADYVKLPSGIDVLAAAVKRHDIGLLIIDPLGAHLDETINANRDSEVRRALAPLVALAQETNMAVIGVRHLNKDESKSALYRGGGSIAFTAAARVVWAVGADPNDQGRQIMAVLKSNIGKKPPAITYSIESHETTSRIRWEGESTCTIGEIFSRKQSRGMKSNGAERILSDLLADGPKPAAEVEQACTDAGIKHWTYKQARKKLGIVAAKGSMREGWLLSLPEEDGFGEEDGEAPVTK
jgi:hypothetical protein